MESIAKTFGTSIIPVREALRQLESEGLVELKSHRGAVATELTLDKALEWIHLRLLIETDAPYLPPVPYRGKRNESSYVPLVAQQLATVYNIPLKEVAKVTTQNAYDLFDL